MAIVQAIADVHRTKVSLGKAATGGTLAAFALPAVDGDVTSDFFNS